MFPLILFFMNNYFVSLRSNHILRNLNLPIFLTLIRILLVPLICMNIVWHYWGLAGLFFMIAVLTDILDGALARMTGSETFLGACLDPLADKFLILGTFFAMAFTGIFKIPIWFNLMLCAKEFVLILPVAYFGIFRNNIKVKSNFMGKAANVFQSICIMLFLLAAYYDVKVSQFFDYVLLFVMIVTVVALCHYLWIGYKELKNEN